MRNVGVKEYEDEGHGLECKKCGGEKCAVLLEWDWEKKKEEGLPPAIGSKLPTGVVPQSFAFGSSRVERVEKNVLSLIGSDKFHKVLFDGITKTMKSA